MCVRLVLLACGIALNILLYKLHEIWPPELRYDKLMSLKIHGMASSLMVMAVSEDRAPQRVLRGNIDTSFIDKNVVVILPV